MTHIIYGNQKNSRAFLTPFWLLVFQVWLFFLSLQIGDKVTTREMSLLTRQASSPTLRQFQQGGTPWAKNAKSLAGARLRCSRAH